MLTINPRYSQLVTFILQKQVFFYRIQKITLNVRINMSHAKILLSFLVISLMVTTCDDLQSVPGNEVKIEGEVTYSELEGGFWTIEDNEETYEPTNLPEEFQQEGLEVTVHAKIEEDKVSFKMVGPIINISSISKR